MEQITTTEKESEAVQKTGGRFRIALSNAEHLKKTLSVFGGLLTEVTARIDTDGLHVVAMDNANVSMVVYTLEPSACEEYIIRGVSEVSFNVEAMHNILKKATKEDRLILTNNEDKLLIGIHGKNKKNVEYPLIELEEKEQRIPTLTFSAELTTNADQLLKELEFYKDVCESVFFNATPEAQFSIQGAGEITKSVTDMTADTKVTKTTDKGVRTKYSLEYLFRICEANILVKEKEGGTGQAQLRFGHDYPLSVLFEKQGVFRLEFILAPRIEND